MVADRLPSFRLPAHFSVAGQGSPDAVPLDDFAACRKSWASAARVADAKTDAKRVKKGSGGVVAG